MGLGGASIYVYMETVWLKIMDFQNYDGKK